MYLFKSLETLFLSLFLLLSLLFGQSPQLSLPLPQNVQPILKRFPEYLWIEQCSVDQSGDVRKYCMCISRMSNVRMARVEMYMCMYVYLKNEQFLDGQSGDACTCTYIHVCVSQE